MSEVSEVTAQIEALGGNVRKDWNLEGYQAQLASLQNDLQARHLNGEDVGRQYPDSEMAQAYAREHRDDVSYIKRAGLDVTDHENGVHVSLAVPKDHPASDFIAESDGTADRNQIRQARAILAEVNPPKRAKRGE